MNDSALTVYPFVVHLGPLEVTGYGIMMMVGFLMGGWLIGQELRRLGLREEYSADIVVAAVVGGVIGAKLWYVALTQDMGALFSRGGMVWYGGFIGGAAAVALNGWRLRVPIRWTMHLAAPALAAAYALGRVGCFLVNDDYGGPTSLPWGIKFPQGYPASTAANLRGFGVAVPEGIDPNTVLAVHPTQLYETAIMLVAFSFLWKWRRLPRPAGWLFGAYLVWAGCERFLIEIFRAKDDRFLGPFTIAQLTSVILVVIGVVLIAKWKDGAAVAPGPYLAGAGNGSASRSLTTA
ncbi:MAG TPA: prolipoprotein diacylglyceryl transferase [Gemmatimonadales bacterium]